MLYMRLNNRISYIEPQLPTMHFCHPKSSLTCEGKEQLVQGCCPKAMHTKDLFLRRNYSSACLNDLFYQGHINIHQNRQVSNDNLSINCKMSLKKTNSKTLARTSELNKNSLKLNANRKRQKALFLDQNAAISTGNTKNEQIMQKIVNPYFPIEKQIQRDFQVLPKKTLQLHNSQLQLSQTPTIPRGSSPQPQIQIQVLPPKNGHQRCKSENFLIQNKTLNLGTQTQSSSKTFMSAVFRQNQNPIKKSSSGVSKTFQKNQKIRTYKPTHQKNLSTECSKKSLVPFPDHICGQDSIISNTSSGILKNTVPSLHSFIMSNGKQLTRLEEVSQVQSLCDENESQSECESIVIGRDEQSSMSLQDEKKWGEASRITQKRLVKFSKLLKTQSVSFL